MKYSPFSCFLFPVLLCALLFSPALSVAQNELVPAQGAVQLRRVWTQEGTHLAAGEYGYNVWGGVDLTGDSIADFAVYRNSDFSWLFYQGGNPPATSPFMVWDSMGYGTPVVGDFLGNGEKTMVFLRGRTEVINQTTYYYTVPSFYALTTEGLVEEPYDTIEFRAFRDVYAGNLDGESGDEFVVATKFDGSDQPGRILVYRGGPDFTSDSPTVIIYDSGSAGNNAPSNWQVRFADFDGDGRTDMVMGGSYPTGGPMLRFYWGDENSPWSWATRPPDRDLQLVDGQIGINSISGLGLFDLDGDGGMDIASQEYEDVAGVRVYLSSKGNVRTRSFDLVDADVTYEGANLGLNPLAVGAPNDARKRFEMLPLNGLTSQGDMGVFYVSGSSYGPDHDYEAWYAPGSDGLLNENVFIFGGGVGDVTGDGWSDILYSAHKYGPFVNTGIAFLLAGGSEIPLDDTTLSVVEHPVAGESGGLYLWPNPVVDELHIAWKGNLKRMPARFTVFDVVGQEVVSGDVEPYRGAALWRCGSVAAGSYRVMLYDTTGEVIATAPIIKQ